MSGSVFEQTLWASAQLGQCGDMTAEAWTLYRTAIHEGRIRKIAAALKGQSRRLLTLPKDHHEVVYEGISAVPLGDIRGSENRCVDFDIEFYPLKAHNAARWVSVAIALQQDTPLPPVELIRLGDTFFVRDGHHRISVARALHQTHIDAVVIAVE